MLFMLVVGSVWPECIESVNICYWDLGNEGCESEKFEKRRTWYDGEMDAVLDLWWNQRGPAMYFWCIFDYTSGVNDNLGGRKASEG